MKRDYYEVLGLERGADTREVKRAFRGLAKELHPDYNPGNDQAAEAFKEVAEAAEVLLDDQKRAVYDRYGHAGLEGGGGGPSDIHDIFGRFGDIFSDIFGGSGRGRSSVRRGADLRYDLSLPFEEAAFGTRVELEIPRSENCERCEGAGAEPGTRPEPCPTCGGRGQVVRTQGAFMMSTTCPSCRGVGKLIRQPCQECRGQGAKRVVRKLPIKIPAGVDTGNRIRVAGEGERGEGGGPPGDLFVVVEVKAHATFERAGADVHSVLDVDFPLAALGGKARVETLHGSETCRIASGTQPGDTIRLKNSGIPHINSSSRGDHILHVRLRVPKKLSREQRKLLEKLADTFGDEGAGA